MARCLGNPWRIGAALLLGLATTVLIAWAAMFWPRNGRDYYGPPAVNDVGLTRTSDGQEIWEISEGHNEWHRVYSYWYMQISGFSLSIPIEDYESREVDLDSLPSHLRPASVDELTMQAWYREVGWPMPALTCSIHWVTQVSNADIIYAVRGGVQLPRDKNFQPQALPLTPVWPGLAVDVALWSAVWLVILSGSAAGRRALRRRWGQCERCAYPRTGLREGSACPECGTQRA